jgi:hypothetical protein
MKNAIERGLPDEEEATAVQEAPTFPRVDEEGTSCAKLEDRRVLLQESGEARVEGARETDALNRARDHVREDVSVVKDIGVAVRAVHDMRPSGTASTRRLMMGEEQSSREAVLGGRKGKTQEEHEVNP